MQDIPMQKFMQIRKTVTDKWTDEGTDKVSKKGLPTERRKVKGKIHPATCHKSMGGGG